MRRWIFTVLLLCSTGPVLAQQGKTVTLPTSEHRTIRQCLDEIRFVTQKPLRLVIDTPQKVTGTFGSRGQVFACSRHETGSKGTYYKGWFQMDALEVQRLIDAATR